MSKILVVDDTRAVLEAMSLLLEIHGFEVITTTTPQEALSLVNQVRVSLVIQDMNFTRDTTSGEEGKSLFNALRELVPDLPIILITAWTDLEQAVELVKSGAADYIAKPWDDAKLITTINNLIELGSSKKQSQQLKRTQQTFDDTKSAAKGIGLVYASAAMQRVVDMAIQVAPSDISVLITGANGSGKEKIAELVQAHSAIKNMPFVKVNCGALPSDLMEAELFGAEAGAYTGISKARIGRFEAADGGTLFLDEIGNLNHAGQTKLLRVLQTGQFERLGSVKTQSVNVRVISATNANLLDQIANGEFREDLYYRLNVIELNLPALSERVDDIMPLVSHFLPDRVISHSAENILLAHAWPGNVRELENACKRVAVLKPEGVIDAEDFLDLASAANRHNVHEDAGRRQVNEPDKEALEQAMRMHEGVIARVARQFGMSRQALYRRLAKYEIEY
ncbi:sigma-54-dependent transcriptional regulator [Ningiella sp. W23]|uniref:sigma-54-dependent transcriptional regulator n=1 Tax=Ningiella sp. W23 TaxID=3023715 RepID=UPI003756F8E1